MALLAILAAMGIAYGLLSSAPNPVRPFELSAVWATLALIAVGMLNVVNTAVTLVLTVVIVAPLWYLTLYMCDQYAQTESANTKRLWQEWRVTVGNRRHGTNHSHQVTHSATVLAADSLSSRLDGVAHGTIIEEIEITEVPEARRAV